MKWLTLIVVVCSAWGCGREGPQRASVAGKITLDGLPIREGSIAFIPAEENRGPTAGGVIADGAFQITLWDGPLVGKNRIELRAWRKTGNMIPNPMNPSTSMEEKVEAFPPQFNAESRLLREIKPGHNQLDLLLRSDDLVEQKE